MDVSAVTQAVLYMASLPLTANVPTLVVTATKMPFGGQVEVIICELGRVVEIGQGDVVNAAEELLPLTCWPGPRSSWKPS
jgi:hypothetical protein